MEFYFGNSRVAPSVESQAEVDLYHWRILQLDTGLLHVAAQMDLGTFRVTTSLRAINLLRRIVITESGRSYRLCVPPEEDLLLVAVMIANVERGRHVISHDVSETVWRAVEAGAWQSKEAALIPALQ